MLRTSAGALLLYAASLAAQENDREGTLLFSAERGFYAEAFDLSVETVDGTPIRYTLDGSDPRTSSRARRVDSPLLLRIDPLNEEGRDRSAAVIVRTSLANDPFAPTQTHTYLFVDRLKDLSPEGRPPGPLWPAPSAGEQSQAIDYGLDPDILENPRYADRIGDAFRALPSLFINTAAENLFDPKTGIYLNAMQRGRQWERPASVELLHPDGEEGFQIDAGLRIRGGYSRRNFNPKHAFRLFFRSEYGKADLEYPLFGAEGADRFDKIDLRTSQNYAWSNGGLDGSLNLMNREVFSRDLQGDMGHPYTRSRYYHLFLNGVYWGLFQTQERAEAAFAATYFGGARNDYDVVKVDPSEFPLTIEATDGDLESWRRVYDLTIRGFSTDAAYYAIQGKDPIGRLSPALESLVDIDNLIDYMLIIFYGGNFDAPVTKWIANKQPNNFYAIYDRRGRDAGFRFFAHDAEHTLLTARILIGDGIAEDRVNIGALEGDARMAVNSFASFHPQWLHHRLSEHPDYRARFAERVQLHFFDGGALTPAANIDRFLRRAAQLETAIIAESARWGDTHTARPSTQDDWRRGIDNIVDNYFPIRGDIVIGQLRRAGLFPALQRAAFSLDGLPLERGARRVDAGDAVRIDNPNGRGRLLYTLDGSDPRQVGGAPSPGALEADDGASVAISRTLMLTARVLEGGAVPVWSTPRRIVLEVEADLGDVRVSEIHYNPQESEDFDGRDLEFLELANAGAATVDLSFAAFTDGIGYAFPPGTLLAPGARLVLAADGPAFTARYAREPFGVYTGQLNNGGERLTLNTAAGDTVLTLRYDDNADWPAAADGEGFSLVLQDLTHPTPDDADAWYASSRLHGTPGWAEEITAVEEETAPAAPSLLGNWPNPFNSRTLVGFDLPRSQPVRLVIHDILGRRVRLLHNGEHLASGVYRTAWDGRDDAGRPVASGVYLYRLVAGNTFSTVGRMALIR